MRTQLPYLQFRKFIDWIYADQPVVMRMVHMNLNYRSTYRDARTLMMQCTVVYANEQV